MARYGASRSSRSSGRGRSAGGYGRATKRVSRGSGGRAKSRVTRKRAAAPGVLKIVVETVNATPGERPGIGRMQTEADKPAKSKY